MKKSLVITLALVFVLGIAGTAFANPYSDVPAGHWAYKAVNDLQKTGVMEGAGGKFMGNQTLTRYEIAAITARAMAKADKADAATKATIDKLAVEFSKELNDLGVRVAKLEKQQSNIKWTAQLRQRYEYTQDATKQKENEHLTRLRLFITAPIDENFTFKGRLAQETASSATAYDAKKAVDKGSNGNIQMDQAYVTGKVGDFTLSLGRMAQPLTQNLLGCSSTNWDGVTAGFTLADAKFVVGTVKKTGSPVLDENFTTAEVAYSPVKDLTATISYMASGEEKAAQMYDTTVYGLKYTGIENFSILAELGKNSSDGAAALNANEKPEAKYFQVKYMGADSKKPGTWGAWVGYKDAEAGYDQKSYNNGDGTAASGMAWFDNMKGYEYGFEYGVFKNAVFQVYFYSMEKQNGVKYPDTALVHLVYSF